MATGFIKKIFYFSRKEKKDGQKDEEETQHNRTASEQEAAAPVSSPAAVLHKQPAAGHPQEKKRKDRDKSRHAPDQKAEKTARGQKEQKTAVENSKRAATPAVSARGSADALRDTAVQHKKAATAQPDSKGAPARRAAAVIVSVSNKVEMSRHDEPVAADEAETTAKRSWLDRLKTGMFRSSQQLTHSISSVFTKRKLDDTLLEELEDILIQADLGLETAARITDTLRSNRFGKDISTDEVRAILCDEIRKVLKPVAKPLELDLSHKPHIILVVGVNGTGKTTTIGKLAAKLVAGGLSVMLAAGDTFRAAAIEQLHIWGKRTGSSVISSQLGADSASLAYEAYEKARAADSDVLIIDTAGRLQNRAELMDELAKIVRVLGKHDPQAPHTVLQTLDATTGQNVLNQVEIFRNTAGVNGLVMTKLDGTARGGILVAIAARHKLPVYFIGVGEDITDLEPFSAEEFAEAIAGNH